MTAFIIENMAPIMFAALVVVLLLGYPAAFSLGAVGLIFGLIGIELGQFSPDFLQALPERVYGVMSNDTLLAIPFFTFMGLVLERSGMAEDLLDTIGQLFGIDMVHLGIIFLANLELGFLMPPVGMNLLLGSYRFNKPMSEMTRASFPMLVVLGIGVLLITYLPWLTTWLPGVWK